MASTINAITTGAGGIVTTGDSSGIVAIQSNGTTYATISVNGITFPSWTTGTRPASPTAGSSGYNTTLAGLEFYTGTSWISIQGSVGYTASYLIVAGGGGGGARGAGGGGAGGYITGTINLTGGTVYTASVGAGGAGGPNGSAGTQGSNSTFTGLTTAIGGGGGGAYVTAASSGGSGGGGGDNEGGSSGTAASGTPGQGNAGGNGSNNASFYGGGGGGGSGTVTQINTAGPITGGPITTTGTINLAVSGVTANT